MLPPTILSSYKSPCYFCSQCQIHYPRKSYSQTSFLIRLCWSHFTRPSFLVSTLLPFYRNPLITSSICLCILVGANITAYWYIGRAMSNALIKITLPAMLSQFIPSSAPFFHFFYVLIPYLGLQIFFGDREAKIMKMAPFFLKRNFQNLWIFLERTKRSVPIENSTFLLVFRSPLEASIKSLSTFFILLAIMQEAPPMTKVSSANREWFILFTSEEIKRHVMAWSCQIFYRFRLKSPL